MLRALSVVLAGLLFGSGLALSGMTDPRKVLGFLDILGNWDPSLLLVLGGAVGVSLLSFASVLRRPAPLLDDRFHLPDPLHVDRRLPKPNSREPTIWGVSGYCPGPGIALLAAPSAETWLFLPAMLLGAALQRLRHASAS